MMAKKKLAHGVCHLEGRCPTLRPSASFAPCENGMAGEYECNSVDQLSFVSLADLGADVGNPSVGGNDIWGWTDPESAHEIAIMGTSDGTSFVDITDPREPIVIGRLETYTVPSLWRDIKVYQNHAFIGAEASGHGMQVFDLTTLRPFYGQKSESVRQLTARAHYGEFGNSHNIAINEATGFAYVIGSGTCSGGPHIVDIRDPANPEFIGCFDTDGYTHDTECVIYHGPDQEFQGREICFLYNENTLTIADVTDKTNPEMLSRTAYENVYYTHQGWLAEDHAHLFMDDEIDELNGPIQNTRTLIWDTSNLRAPVHVNDFFSEMTVSDHNQYTKGDFIFQGNYKAGLRILHIDAVPGAPYVGLQEVGFFDVAPGENTPGFEGTWSTYPYFPSGTIVATSMERGLFVLDATAALAKKKQQK
jgi:choice-of-anchor B domain-containing protein